MALVVRFTQILEFLVAKGQATEMQLSHLIKASEQTVRSVMTQLNQALEDVAVITRDKKMYRLVVKDYDELALLLGGGIKAIADFNSSDKRIAYICKVMIELGGYILIDDIADELVVSRGTIQKDLRKLGQLVTLYDGQLESKPNCGVRLLASEFGKRLIFLNHVYDYYQYELKFDSDFFDLLDNLYDKLKLNQIQVTTFERELLLLINRIQAGHIIETEIDNYCNLVNHNEFLNDFFIKIENKLNRNLTQYEQDFMAYPLNMNNNFPFDATRIDFAFINRLIHQIVMDIDEEYPIQMNQTTLFEALKFHVTFLLNRTRFQYQEKNIFFKSIQNRYPFAYQLAEIAKESIKKVTGLVISDIELNTLAIYFELSLSKVRIDSTKKVALIANVGTAAKRMLYLQIRTILGEDIVMTELTEEAANQDFSEFMVVFTTVPLKAISSNVMEIQVANLLDDDFITTRLRTLKNSILLDKSKVKMTMTHLNQTYSENLIQMMGDLEQQGKVDSQFAERILARNQTASTIFENTFAFPHTINVGSSDIVLSIGLAPKDEISLIFMLAVPENLLPNWESDLVKVYDMIFEIVGKPELQYEILKMENLEQLQGLLKRKGLII
ncbi:BglG family transcription antiterminator [Pseudolactococcus laudensis]|uniref:BglG family transcription antiterminator n=1 Tax=Pseudolactococcus laudensis TaxID=1494461 RepID=UPI003F9CF07B